MPKMETVPLPQMMYCNCTATRHANYTLIVTLVLVLVLVLIKDHITIKRMLAPKGIRIPGLHSYVSVYKLT